MKRICGVSLIAVGLLTWHAALAANPNYVNEVKKLKAAGLNEDTIVAFVKSKNYNFELTADDAIALKNEGFPAPVLTAMLESGKDAAPVAASVAPPAQTTAPLTAVTAAPAVTAPAGPSVGSVVQVQTPVLGPEAAYFYQELSPYGRWILTEDNQWYWQPSEASRNPDWRPYWDRGHWVYTDNGWYWASDYAWGWAAFHYGRWQLHPHHGWLWFPDRVWAPAWVLWRAGGDYCGWAPLPPGAAFDHASSRFSFRGRVVDAGFDFGLDWLHFSFSYVKEMGEQPRAHFRKEVEVRSIIKQTTVINNYTVIRTGDGKRAGEHSGNPGIDPKRVELAKGRPVEPMRVQDLRSPAPGKNRENLNRRSGTLEVFRPKLGEPAHHR